MNAARIHRFGAPDVIVVEDIPRPVPEMSEVLVRVAASGVAPWDALIRQGKSKVSAKPSLTLGSDFAGVVEASDRASISSPAVMKSSASRTRSVWDQMRSMPLPRHA